MISVTRSVSIYSLNKMGIDPFGLTARQSKTIWYLVSCS